MKAIKDISYQQKLENRESLEKVLPLKAPLSLQIELASACNFKCKFCIHGNDDLLRNGKYKSGIMTYDLFTKLVDDLKNFENPIKFISLQSRGESFLNPRLADMIKYLKESKVTKEIGINTNASLLHPELNLQIIEAGLDVIRISIEGVSEAAYKDVAGVDINYKQMIENITHLYEHRNKCHVYIKIIDCGMTAQEKDKFYADYGNICDTISIENPVDAWQDADLNAIEFKTERYNVPVSECVVCPRIFFACVIHFDGTVIACDHDWSEQYILGDVNRDSIVDIWNGEKLNALRRKHLLKQSSEIDRCKSCVNLKSSFLDNIDAFADTLLQYYRED